MGMIRVSDIVGIFESDEVVCTNCCRDGEWDAFTEDEVIRIEEAEMGDFIYFCSRCKKRLPVPEEEESQSEISK